MPSTKTSADKQSSHKRRTGHTSKSQSTTVEVRDSSIHGRGVYATLPIPKGTRIIEYTGKRMSWADVPGEDDDPHTFLFALDNGEVINPGGDGSEARGVTHCLPP